MRIGLHDSDNTNFPNLALMKISAWHKKQGHNVSFYTPFEKYDKVYSSKIFTWSNDFYLRGNVEKGGIGYNLFNELKDFARWINHKAIFKSVPWEEYKCHCN